MICNFEIDCWFFMCSSSSTKQIVSSDDGNLSLPKIATPTTNTIDRQLARIVAGNAGVSFSHDVLLFHYFDFFSLEHLRTHLDSMYKFLRPDDRLTLVS